MKKLLAITISLILISTAYSQNQETLRKPFTINCHSCEILSQPQPKYPAIAKAVNASGKVNVQVLIDENGNVIEAKALDGYPFLQAESVKAAYQAKFKPKTLSNVPVRMRALLVYNFNLNDEKTEQTKAISLGVLNDKAKVLPLPKLLNVQPRIAGSVNVQVKIDLQKGEVVSASAVSGHPLLRMSAENAAKQAKFEPVLTEFSTIYGTGVLVYKVEDFTGKVVENNKPKPFSIINKDILNSKTTFFAAPVKTKEASAACVGGKVEVAVLVDAASGEVIAAQGIAGKEILYETVETAALKSKFSPSAIDGSGNIYVKGKFLYEFGVPKCGGSNVLNNKALSVPKPIVKNSIRRRYLQSKSEQTVTVQVVVDETGAVIEAKALTGNTLLRAACEISARAAKFAPTLINMPIKVPGIIIYKFNPDGTISDDFPKL